MTHQHIRIHPLAPAKPALGDACNGCGVCCAAEPCPIGVLVSGRREGACRALAWDESVAHYRCGMVSDAARHLPRAAARAAPLLARLSARLISAGSGCDSDAQVLG